MLRTGDAPAATPPTPVPPAPAPATQAPPPEIAPGTIVAGHKVLDYVGGSELTAAYKASQTSMGRTVLFKTLRPKYVADEGIKGRFFAGARAAARLNHPNLLSVFDMGEEGGVCFYTTEFVPGGDLPHYLAAHEEISSEERVAIVNQIAQALAHAETEGVEQVWLSPDNVLLTDKGDVRVSHVGTGTPLSGGAPQPIMDALARLVYMATASRDLPPGGTDALELPFSRDAVGSKLNNTVERLVKERHNAYKNAEEFAAELQELVDGIQRRGTVNAAAAPGGVVPLRLERAHRREFPLKTVLIATIAVSLVATLIIIGIYNHARTQKREGDAEALHKQAMEAYKNRDTRVQALRLFEQLGQEYPDTEYGKSALYASEAQPGNIRVAKDKVVDDALSDAYAPFREKPRQREDALAEIIGARHKVERVVGKYPGLDKVEAKYKREVRGAYTVAARKGWKDSAKAKIEGLCRTMHYGDALKVALDYQKQWPDCAYASKATTGATKKIDEWAKKRFEELMKEAQDARAGGYPRKADESLDKIIRNFGIPQYVEMAKAKRD
jgi:protein kinase-like protein